MHVRIAWEIYNHQQKEKTGGGTGAGVGSIAGAGLAGVTDKDKLRGFPPAPPPAAAPYRSPYDLPPAPYLHHPHLGQCALPKLLHLRSSRVPRVDFMISSVRDATFG